MRLKGKVAVVTGSAQGIGKAIACAFAKEGAKVALADLNLERVQQTEREITAGGATAKAFRCDVSNRSQCQALIKNVVETFGTVDILMNCAGIMINRQIEDYSEEEWDRVMNVNLKGSFLMSQAVVPLMKKNRYGKIILIASIAATNAFPEAVAYCASKGGVLMIMKALAAEVAKFGINVNCVSPGNTATPLNQHLRNDPDFVKLMASYTPTGRAYIDPPELAGAAVFLASDDARAVYGLNLLVDDGWCLM